MVLFLSISSQAQASAHAYKSSLVNLYCIRMGENLSYFFKWLICLVDPSPHKRIAKVLDKQSDM